jgi:mannose-1-phosphate guanylyltransferase/mannose-6-phosphate isomerase
MNVIPVILSGGSGTRLWPLSRGHYPKQFLPLSSDKSMFQETILRLNGIKELSAPIVVCNDDHRFIVAEQLNQINILNATILLEPVGKNTAPAIAAAALESLRDDSIDDQILLVFPADHVIEKAPRFLDAIHIAVKNAKKNRLVTFGILPTNANTGYGYIKSSNELDNNAYKVEKFVEKPSIEVAESYIKEGRYLWNSGMFVFSAKTLIKEYEKHSKDILICAQNSINKATKDLDFVRLDHSSFQGCPSDSIDYALMEKSNNVYLVPLDAGWNDIGSWPALYDMGSKNQNQNVTRGDIIDFQTHNSYISSSNRLITTIGLKDVIVVDTPDVTLISSKESAHKVKDLVERLKKDDRPEVFFHRKVYRPWGWYDSIEKGLNFQVKRLHINPGAKLSLQMHYKRAEHWVVVEGVATVINGENELTLLKGQSTYIPLETKHSLQNLEKTSLEIIEVQSGVYLEEDDIVRFEDIYGRISK